MAQAKPVCPLDLRRLLPVPPAILRRGAGDEQADTGLRQHWGVRDQPRHAAVLAGRTAGRRRPAGHTPLVYRFFIEGPAPEAALRGLRECWTALTLRLERGEP